MGRSVDARGAPLFPLLAFLAIAAPSAALADNLCSQGEAPDVITGDIIGVVRHGTLEDITAYSVGTTSCNVGTCQANWIQDSAEHPLIAQNLFRLRNGRFEQIGQSWVKHAFSALQQGACSPSCLPADDQHLGVNCSDPYTSNLNGAQARHGPKYEVNAFTGVYPYPATDMNEPGDVIYKRLQVHNADLDPALNAGALYVVEAQYIAHDDARAGNGANNMSYRPASVTGHSIYTLTLGGSTVRLKPAIEAWKAADASVVLTYANAPGDGTMVIGARVTPLGGGMFRYEYAVENINCDRGAGSFRIPIAPGTVVANTGFHDVDYHSGEPIDGTDWTVTVGAKAVTWATAPYEADPGANALRWGTLYNFRFDAGAAPVATTATLGSFKPGAAGSFGMSTLGPDPCSLNGVCGLDETCANCAADCQHQGGGAGCCGNGVCEVGENPCLCGADCGPALASEATCGNGIDEDCDGSIDCADTDCCASAACAASDPDGDHVAAPCDCDSANAQVHATPGEARSLMVSRDGSGAAHLAWSPPTDPGGAVVRYDTLRSSAPNDFTGSAVCIETGGADTSSIDTVPQAPGIFYYLVRAVNDCPSGQGSIGDLPNGQPRPGRACP